MKNEGSSPRKENTTGSCAGSQEESLLGLTPKIQSLSALLQTDASRSRTKARGQSGRDSAGTSSEKRPTTSNSSGSAQALVRRGNSKQRLASSVKAAAISVAGLISGMGRHFSRGSSSNMLRSSNSIDRSHSDDCSWLGADADDEKGSSESLLLRSRTKVKVHKRPDPKLEKSDSSEENLNEVQKRPLRPRSTRSPQPAKIIDQNSLPQTSSFFQTTCRDDTFSIERLNVQTGSIFLNSSLSSLTDANDAVPSTAAAAAQQSHTGIFTERVTTSVESLVRHAAKRNDDCSNRSENAYDRASDSSPKQTDSALSDTALSTRYASKDFVHTGLTSKQHNSVEDYNGKQHRHVEDDHGRRHRHVEDISSSPASGKKQDVPAHLLSASNYDSFADGGSGSKETQSFELGFGRTCLERASSNEENPAECAPALSSPSEVGTGGRDKAAPEVWPTADGEILPTSSTTASYSAHSLTEPAPPSNGFETDESDLQQVGQRGYTDANTEVCNGSDRNSEDSISFRRVRFSKEDEVFKLNYITSGKNWLGESLYKTKLKSIMRNRPAQARKLPEIFIPPLSGVKPLHIRATQNADSVEQCKVKWPTESRKRKPFTETRERKQSTEEYRGEIKDFEETRQTEDYGRGGQIEENMTSGMTQHINEILMEYQLGKVRNEQGVDEYEIQQIVQYDSEPQTEHEREQQTEEYENKEQANYEHQQLEEEYEKEHELLEECDCFRETIQTSLHTGLSETDDLHDNSVNLLVTCPIHRKQTDCPYPPSSRTELTQHEVDRLHLFHLDRMASYQFIKQHPLSDYSTPCKRFGGCRPMLKPLSWLPSSSEANTTGCGRKTDLKIQLSSPCAPPVTDVAEKDSELLDVLPPFCHTFEKRHKVGALSKTLKEKRSQGGGNAEFALKPKRVPLNNVPVKKPFCADLPKPTHSICITSLPNFTNPKVSTRNSKTLGSENIDFKISAPTLTKPTIPRLDHEINAYTRPNTPTTDDKGLAYTTKLSSRTIRNKGSLLRNPHFPKINSKTANLERKLKTPPRGRKTKVKARNGSWKKTQTRSHPEQFPGNDPSESDTAFFLSLLKLTQKPSRSDPVGNFDLPGVTSTLFKISGDVYSRCVHKNTQAKNELSPPSFPVPMIKDVKGKATSSSTEQCENTIKTEDTLESSDDSSVDHVDEATVASTEVQDFHGMHSQESSRDLTTGDGHEDRDSQTSFEELATEQARENFMESEKTAASVKGNEKGLKKPRKKLAPVALRSTSSDTVTFPKRRPTLKPRPHAALEDTFLKIEPIRLIIHGTRETEERNNPIRNEEFLQWQKYPQEGGAVWYKLDGKREPAECRLNAAGESPLTRILHGVAPSPRSAEKPVRKQCERKGGKVSEPEADYISRPASPVTLLGSVASGWFTEYPHDQDLQTRKPANLAPTEIYSPGESPLVSHFKINEQDALSNKSVTTKSDKVAKKVRFARTRDSSGSSCSNLSVQDSRTIIEKNAKRNGPTKEQLRKSGSKQPATEMRDFTDPMISLWNVPTRIVESWKESSSCVRNFVHRDPRRVMSTSNIHTKIAVQKAFIEKVPLLMIQQTKHPAETSCRFPSGLELNPPPKDASLSPSAQATKENPRSSARKARHGKEDDQQASIPASDVAARSQTPSMKTVSPDHTSAVRVARNDESAMSVSKYATPSLDSADSVFDDEDLFAEFEEFPDFMAALREIYDCGETATKDI